MCIVADVTSENSSSERLLVIRLPAKELSLETSATILTFGSSPTFIFDFIFQEKFGIFKRKMDFYLTTSANLLNRVLFSLIFLINIICYCAIHDRWSELIQTSCSIVQPHIRVALWGYRENCLLSDFFCLYILVFLVSLVFLYPVPKPPPPPRRCIRCPLLLFTARDIVIKEDNVCIGSILSHRKGSLTTLLENLYQWWALHFCNL